VSFKARMMQAVAEDARRRALVLTQPEVALAAAAARAQLRRETAAQERAEHEVAEGARVLEHLKRCGLREGDAKLVAAGLSEDWGLVGEGAQRTSALRAVRRWWADADSLLLCLFGAPGTGKTLAVGELLTQMRWKYHHPDWGPTWCWATSVADAGMYVLAADLAANVFAPEMEKQRYRMQHCRLLVVDELGAEVASGPWQSLLQNVLVCRHAASRRTVLASNVAGAEFRERYGDVITRRVSDDGTAVSLGDSTLTGGEPIH
jgi:DNA replication protein DnaC